MPMIVVDVEDVRLAVFAAAVAVGLIAYWFIRRKHED